MINKLRSCLHQFTALVWRMLSLARLANTPAKSRFESDRKLMLRFQSLGDNCEFGLVQRHYGAEPMGVFRFSWTPIDAVIKSIDQHFSYLQDPTQIDVVAHDAGHPRKEYMVVIRAYGIVYHTEVFEDQMSLEDIRAQELMKLKFLGRKIVDDLREGGTIFVLKSNAPIDADLVEQVSERIGSRGTCVLLWVTLADPAHKPGAVEWIGRNLIRGYIERFAIYENAHDTLPEAWRIVCENALKLYESEQSYVPVRSQASFHPVSG